jgi:hypothetical protein
MAIKADQWVCQMAINNQILNPFEGGSVLL